MSTFTKFLLTLSLLSIISCSSSYDKLTKNSFNTSDEFSKYLFNTYKQKAIFEAKEMHDWNSAKLYSEKALAGVTGKKIFPQKISYWNIEPIKRFELIKGYNNLMIIYKDALILDPINLAKAISSLDCWSEQQEENWQTWDINQCRDDFLKAMHKIYQSLNEKKQESSKLKKTSDISKDLNTQDNSTSIVVVKDDKKNILQTIYFDFDKSSLTNISINKIHQFIEKYKNSVKKFIIVGHTDTMGSKEYNFKLSLERAKTIKMIFLEMNIANQNISILGKGENDLNIDTEDEVPHPANRRAEISLLN